MTNLLMHDSRRLVLPLDTTVDALIEFDRAHRRWPERVTLHGARLGPSGVVISVRQSGQEAPIERTYSLAIVAAAIIHYCAKMRVPVPKNGGPRPPLRLVASDPVAEDVIRLTYVPA